jgi:hypothetical protein
LLFVETASLGVDETLAATTPAADLCDNDNDNDNDNEPKIQPTPAGI